MASINSNTIEIDIIGNITLLENTLSRGVSSLHNFFNQATKLAKDQESEARASSIRAAKLMQETMEQKRRLFLAMHNDESNRRNKELQEAKSAESKKLSAYQSFFVAAENLSKQHVQNQVRREQEATTKLLQNFRIRQKEFEKHEKEITKTIEQEAIKQKNARHTAIQSIAHTIPFGIGRTAAFIGANAESFSASSGISASGVEAFSAAISKIPIPVIAAVAATFIIVKKTIDLAKQALFEYIVPAIGKGLQYNDLLENTTYGLAGIISQMTDIYRGQEQITKGAERWAGSLAISEDIVVMLQDAALKTRAVFTDLSRGMQEGFAPFLQMGGTQEQITPFVTRFIHLMATLKIPLREIGQEIRAFSNLDTNPRTARASFAIIGMAAKQMGVDFKEAKARLKSFAEDGTLVQWMMDNTKEFQRSGEAAMHTLSGQLSNVKELWDRILGEGTKELYEGLKKGLDDLVKSFVTFDKTGKAIFSPEAVATIKSIADVFQSLIPIVSSLIKLIANFLSVLTKIKDTLVSIASGTKWVIDLVITQPKWFKDLMGNKDATERTREERYAGVDKGGETRSSYKIRQDELKRIMDEREKQYKEGLFTPLKSGLDQYVFKNYSKDPRDSMFNFSHKPGTEEEAKAYEELTEFMKKLDIERYAEAKRKSEEWVKEHDAATKEVARLYLSLNKKITEQNIEILKSSGVISPEVAAFRVAILNAASEYNEAISEHKERAKFAVTKEEINSWNNVANAIQETREQAEKLALLNLSKHKVESLSFLFGKADAPIKATVEDSFDRNLKLQADTARLIADYTSKKMEQAADRFNEITEKHWRGPMSSVFADLGKTGGLNFLNVMQQGFDNLIEDGAANLTDALANLLGFGGTLSTSTEKDDAGNIIRTNYLRNGLSINESDYAKMLARQKQMQAAMGLAQIGFGSYQAGATGQKGSVTAGLIGGGISGASIGMSLATPGGPFTAAAGAVVGAIVGALVGAVTAAMGKAAAREEYKFAQISMNAFTGNLGLFNKKNIEEPEAEAMIARLQDTFDKFWGSYTALAIKFAAKYLPTLKDFFSEIPISIQPNASANFLKHWEEFIAGTLPDMLMEKFRGSLEDVAGTLGMGANKFTEIWTKLNTLDPSKTLELLGFVFETLTNFNKIQARRDMDVPSMGGGFSWGMLQSQANFDLNKRPINDFANIDEQIRNASKLSLAFAGMTSEQQIRAAHELSNLLVQRMEMEKEFAKQMVLFLQDSSRSFDSIRRQYNLEGMGSIVKGKDGTKTFAPNYQEQADYLKEYLDKIMIGIGNAANPDQLAYWQSEFFNTINQMGSIYQQMGPEAYEAFRQWMLGGAGQQGVLDIVQGAITTQVNTWGEAIADSTLNLFNQIQPAIDVFKNIVTITGDIIDQTGNKIGELPGKTREVIGAFGDLVTSIDTLVTKIDEIDLSGASSGTTIVASNSQTEFTSRIVRRRLASSAR